MEILLGACDKWNNVVIGKQALECGLDKNDPAAYVSMSKQICCRGPANAGQGVSSTKIKLWSMEGAMMQPVDRYGRKCTRVCDRRENDLCHQLILCVTVTLNDLQ